MQAVDSWLSLMDAINKRSRVVSLSCWQLWDATVVAGYLRWPIPTGMAAVLVGGDRGTRESGSGYGMGRRVLGHLSVLEFGDAARHRP